MPIVKVTAECAAAIRSAATNTFRPEGTVHADGSVSIPLSDEVYERIKGQQQAGESESDAILRVVSTAGRPQN